MDVHADLEAACRPDELFAWVDDLTNYPPWLEIVTQAQPLESPGTAADAAPEQLAWAVDLRGRLGPMARSKRLRMVRTRHDPGRSVTFERSELDGRDHSPWILEVEVGGEGERSRLSMDLHYGGGLFGSVIERVLRDEIDRSRDRLRDLVESATPPPTGSPSESA